MGLFHKSKGPKCPLCITVTMTPTYDVMTGATMHECPRCKYTTLYAKDAEREQEQRG